jgi:hypothetical protein
MKLKLKQIDPVPAGKMLGALYGLMALVMVPFMLGFMALGSMAARQQGGDNAPALPLMFGMGIGFMIFLPVIYALMGFVFGVIGAWVYNLVARWLGGFAFVFEADSPPPAVAPPPL